MTVRIDYQSGTTYRVGDGNVTLTAIWIRVFTVKYTMNGATTAAPADVLKNENDKVTLADAPVRPGYTFNQWTNQSGTGFAPGAEMTISSTSYLVYAQWTPVPYTISYELNGGTSSQPSSFTKTIGQVVTVESAPTRSGSQFDGWSYGEKLYGPGASVIVETSDITFTATWTAINYSVSYEMNGSSSTKPTESNKTITQTFTIASAPSRSGYNFVNWSDGASTFNPGATYTVADSDVTLTAQWSAINYTLTYNLNGGVGSTPTGSTTLNIGDTFTVAAAPPQSDRSFLGWSDGVNNYTAGQTYRVGAENITLTATWSGVLYEITYDLNGGVGSAPSETAKETSETFVVKSDSGISRTNYTFGGWKIGATSVSIGQTITVLNSEIILVAQWIPNFGVTFDASGGSSVGSLTYTGNPLAKPTDPTRTSFVFEGWTKSGELVAWPYTPNGPVALTAKWTQESLYGLSPSDLKRFGTLTIQSGLTSSFSGSNATSSVTITVPAGALPDGTVLNIDLVENPSRAIATMPSGNSYLISFVVSWLATDGTVPDTAEGKPITMVITNSEIKEGKAAYSILGETVTLIGRAEENGSITTLITRDPEIVIAATLPDAPTDANGSNATAASFTASWTPPTNNGGANITQYIATTNSGQSCTTSTTSCEISGLTASTDYTFQVVATNRVGNSTKSSASLAVRTLSAAGSEPNRPLPSPQPVPTIEPNDPNTTSTNPTPRPATTGPSPTPTRFTPNGQPNNSNSPNLGALPVPTPRVTPTPTPTTTPVDTIDNGRGVAIVASGPMVSDDQLSQNSNVRSLSELSREVQRGFAPNVPVTIELVGARTTGQFLIIPGEILDPLAVSTALRESTARTATDFASIGNATSVPAPTRNQNLVVGQLTTEMIKTLKESKLLNPLTVDQLDIPENTSWIRITADVSTYKPGSEVYLVVTSQPIIFGVQKVGLNGTAEISGLLPLQALQSGGHAVRVVGTRYIEGAYADENGEIALTSAALGEIQKFDMGTQATVKLIGPNSTGGNHLVIREVALDNPIPWWTLWIVGWTALLFISS
jgi:uncharacterized repeat protein (TIGR02543 family)